MSHIELNPEFKIELGFIAKPDADVLLQRLIESVPWDTSMKARMTACFGESYDDSGVSFETQPMHHLLKPICTQIEAVVGFLPTNCLLNYYRDGKSTMGFHSDVTSYLEPNTGIVIVSLGSERELTFRNKNDYNKKHSVKMKSGSLFCMTQLTQDYWTHAIKKSDIEGPRISLTFRRILTERKAR